jgi:hypothetical protein
MWKEFYPFREPEKTRENTLSREALPRAPSVEKYLSVYGT